MKTLLVINANHAIDIITNSSSELFVLKGKTKKLVIKMIKNIYPEYLTEYSEIKTMQDLDARDIDTYLSYSYNGWSNLKQKDDNKVVPGFTFDEMYEIPSWQKDRIDPSYYIKDSFVEDNLEAVKKALDPNGEMFFLFSINDNPNWDKQEELMQIGTRYHLG